MRLMTLAMPVLLFFACTKPPGAGPDASSGAASTGGAGAASAGPVTTSTNVSDACSPAALGLGSSTPAPAWTVPQGCAASGPAKLVRTDAELREILQCSGAGPGAIDFAKQSLLIGARTMSPASMGTAVYDDGKTLTLVNRFRSPCPNDPMPMPTPFTLAVQVPAGPRAIREVSCNVETKCK